MPNPGSMQFKIKITKPTVSDTSTSDSGQCGKATPPYLGTTPYPDIKPVPLPGAWFSTNLSGSSLIFIISFSIIILFN